MMKLNCNPYFRFCLFSLITVLLICVGENKAEANGCPIVSPDSTISFTFSLLDVEANPVARASGDSLWIVVYYPSGALAFRDSARILNDGNITYTEWRHQGKTTAVASYKRLVSAIDGTAQDGPYAVYLHAWDSSLGLITPHHYCFQERAGMLDSLGVDESQLADLNIKVNSGDTILADVIKYEGLTDVDAEIQSEVRDAILEEFTFGPSGGVDANVVDWEGLGLALSASGSFPSVDIGSVSGSTTADDNLEEAFDNDNVFTTGGFEAQVDSINAAQKGQMADSVWGTGHSGDRRLTSLDEDDVTIDLNATTIGTVTNLTNNNPNLDGATGTLANSQIDDDVDVNVLTITNGIIDTIDFTAAGKMMPYQTARRDSLYAITNRSSDTITAVTATVTAGAINLDAATGTLANSQIDDDVDVNVKTVTAGAIDSADFAADVKFYIGYSVWRTDTSNAAWDGVLGKFGEWNAQAQTGGSGGGGCTSCGTGAQALTIVVIDTSGTDATVPYPFITIQNSAQTSIIAYGTGNSSGSLSGLFTSASTAYKGIAIVNGYYFPTYSFTTGSGASHTDTIRGYDIPTSAGSAVPSNQQVQLYDWAISPANDTLYGAKVTITLVGATDFYTSTVLVPPTSVVVYAGINDGTGNGGKWQETVFKTDSLMSPGDVSATYSIEIEHPLLELSGQKIVYSGIVLTGTGAIRLRDVVAFQ